MGNLTINTTENLINITPTDVQLSVYGGGFAPAGGANSELQYNDNGRLAGTANFYFYDGNVITGDDNFKILGGNNGYYLQTDGQGNLTWYPGTAFPTGNGTVGGANMQIQYNNSGNFGGYPGFILDNSTGNFNAPGNANIVGNILLNGNLNFKGGNITNANVISSNRVSVTGNINSSGNIIANFYYGNGAFLTGLQSPIFANGTSNVIIPTINGNILFSVNNVPNVLVVSQNLISATGNVQANYFIGNGALLSGIDTAGISNGTSNVKVYNNGNVNVSIAGTSNVFNITTTDITSTKTISTSGNVQAAYLIGNGSTLASITGANITGTVANATYAINAGSAGTATTADTVTTNAQPNITSIGNLTSLNIVGTTTLQQVKEKVNVNNVSANNIVNFDILTSAILFQTSNATGNFTLNIRGNSTQTFNNIANINESVTCTFINKNGNTGQIANVIQIDGVTANVVWPVTSNGAPTVGTSLGRDMYIFNIIKTSSNTYTTFATFIGYR